MSVHTRPDSHYASQETFTAAQWRDYHLGALQTVVASAFAHSAEFKSRMLAEGLKPEDIRSLEDFAKIRPLRKKDLLQLQRAGDRLGGMVAMELGRLKRIYQSPGPIFDPEGEGPDYWGWAEGFHAAGFRKGDLVQMTFGYHLTPAGLMLEEPLREIGCCVIPAGPGNTEVQIELMRELPVTGFVGMASYLKAILDRAEEKGLDIRKALKLQVAFVAAERLPESLRRELQERMRMLVRQGYGTADVGCIAYECRELGGMHCSSRAYVEICEPGTGRPLPAGETGEVVVTPFQDAYPLIRLATGDLSYIIAEPCACGRTAPRLGGIVGRVDDTAKVKGQFIYPAQAAEVAAAFPEIACWQIRVDNPDGKDRLTVCLTLKGELDRDAYVKAFQERLKLRPIIEVLAEGELAPGDRPLVDARTFD